MLEACFYFIVSVVNSLTPISSMFPDSNSLAFLLRVQSNTTTSTNNTAIITKAINKAREEADRLMAKVYIESTITSLFLSGTSPIIV